MMKRVALACLLCVWLPLHPLSAGEAAPPEETARPENPPADAGPGKQTGEQKAEQAPAGGDEEPECD